MKKLIVLSVVLLSAAFNLTSCEKKETKVETDTTISTDQPADSLSQPAADTTATQTTTTATTTDTVVEKK
jgi:hypothetical protein